MTVIDVNIVKLVLLLSKNAKKESYLEHNGKLNNAYRSNRNLEKYRENAGNFEIYSVQHQINKLSGQPARWKFDNLKMEIHDNKSIYQKNKKNEELRKSALTFPWRKFQVSVL